MADLSRIIQAAAQAALDDSSQSRMQQASQKVKHKGLSMPRAFLVGAGLFTAGRMLVRYSGRDLVESLQHRLEEFELQHGDSDDGYDEEEEFDEEPEGEFDEDEEPEGEFDEDEEPEGEFDEDEEPEGEFDEDEEPEGEFDEDEEPEGEFDEDEEPEEERSRAARSSG
jgi:hypothetical protein